LEQASDNRTARPVLELAGQPGTAAGTDPAALPGPGTAPDGSEQLTTDEELSGDLDNATLYSNEDTAIQIIRATRTWIQYGMVGFTVFCIVIGALESVLIHLGL
jgi:hypothetical protein